MSKTLVIVGTRKGCFILESTTSGGSSGSCVACSARWPIYHAVHDADTGAIYAAGASEWHGASIWRSLDRGETWTQSSEGLEYGETGLKLEGLGPDRRPRAALRRRGDARHLREP